MAKQKTQRVSAEEVRRAEAVLRAAEAQQRGRQRTNSRRGCMALLVCGVITMAVAWLGGGRESERIANLPTVAALPSETPVPSETPIPTETPLPTETPAPSATLSEVDVQGTENAVFVMTAVVQLTAMFAPTATETPAPTNAPIQPTATAVEAVMVVSDQERNATAWAIGELIDQVYRQQAGMIASRSVADACCVYVEAVVDAGFNSLAMAERLRQLAAGVVSTGEFDAILQGDGRLSNYIYRDSSWRTTELTPIDLPLVDLPEGTVVPTFRPPTLPPAPPPTTAPVLSTPVQQGSIYTCNGIDDLNCGDFPRGSGAATRHMQQCGDEDDLDGDEDGLACEDR